MKVAGIIAEYNPFHAGHQYHMDQTRIRTGCDFLVVVMSGDYVQRGAPAVWNKWIRAGIALDAGADLVLELPINASTGSAARFAEGAVRLLHSCGCIDVLSFGSEHGTMEDFTRMAEVLAKPSPELEEGIRTRVSQGMTYPAAREAALCALAPDLPFSLLRSPNNILGLEYCLALKKEKSSILPITVKREGAGYQDTSPDHSFPSAQGIRAMEKKGENISALLPACTNFFAGNRSFLPAHALDSILGERLCELTSSSLPLYQDLTPDLMRRIYALRDGYTTLEEFALSLKTKQYTLSRIHRALLHLILQLPDVPLFVPCVKVLGMRKQAAPLLSRLKELSSLPVVTKLSAFPMAEEVLASDLFASRLYGRMEYEAYGALSPNEFQRPLILLP